MGKFLHTQNSFASGEISPDFLARGDSAASARGLSQLTNMDVLPSGAITRRCGTIKIGAIDSDSILIPFAYRDDECYLLVLAAGHIFIYRDDELYQDLISPFSTADLKNVQYAQRFNTMIFVHPDYRPQILRRNNAVFELADFQFRSSDDWTLNIPFMRFDDTADVRLALSATGQPPSTVQITASANCFSVGHVGARLLLAGKQWLITAVASATQLTAVTNGTFTVPSSAILDWKESAFSTARGWPASLTFHQDRLVFGGSRDWPAGVWMSKVADHYNFDVGTGLDDEAIFLTLLSDRQQQIATVVSSDNLQILTTTGEWAISSKPLTPSVIDIKQHTSVGSAASHYLPPQLIEGCTVFVSKSGREIRELVLDNLSETYSAVDLCALSSHLMKTPVSCAYNDEQHRLYVVCADGEMAVLTKISPLEISAWARYSTAGRYISVAAMNADVYVTVVRDNVTYLEKFSDSAARDCDDLEFDHVAAALPLMSGKNAPKNCRIAKLSARVLNTKSLAFVIDGKAHSANLPNEIHGENHDGFSGDIGVNTLGTETDMIRPLWIITNENNLPATILSVTVDGRYAI